MNAQEMQRDRAITALIEAGKITEDDAYPTNDMNACYVAQDALIAQHTVIKQQTQATASYVVIDRHTGLQVGKTYRSRVAASRRVDVLDNAYGAYRYAVRKVTQ